MLQAKNSINPNAANGDSPNPLCSENQTPTKDLIKSTSNRKNEQADTSCPKKFSMTEKIWGVLIRPQSRVQYDVSMLGPRCFLLSGKVMGRREDFQVKNSRGFLLECSYFEPTEVSNLKHPCLLYLHGNASSRLEGLHLLGSSLAYGFSLLLMDFAGCGLSQGEYISMSYFEKDDVKLVMDYVRKWKEISEFGIWGRSMGAATALMTALEVDESIRYVVVDSCFLSVRKLCKEVVRSKICLPSCLIDCAIGYVRRQVKQKAQFDLQQCDILQAVINSKKRTNLPSILFLAAKGDTLVNCNHSQQLFAAYSGTKSINIFEGTHNSKRPREILEQAGMFFYEGFFDEYAMSMLSPHKVEAEHLLFVDLKKTQEIPHKGEKDSSQNGYLDKEINIDKKEQHSIKLEFKKKRRNLEVEQASPQLSLPFSGKSKIPEQSQFGVSSQARMTSNLFQHNRSNTVNHDRLKQNLGDGSNDDDDFLSRKIKINSRSNVNNKVYPNESNSSDSSLSDRSICRALDPSKCKCTKLKRKTQSTQLLKVLNIHKETATTVATMTNQHRDGQISEITPQSVIKTGHIGLNNLIFSQPARINLSNFSNVFNESPQLANESNSPTRKKHISELPVFINTHDQIDNIHPNSPQKQNNNNTRLEEHLDRIENPQTLSGNLQNNNNNNNTLTTQNEESNQEQNNEEIIKQKPSTSTHSREADGKPRETFNTKVIRSFSKRQSNFNNQNSSLFHPSNNSAQTNSSIVLPLHNNNKTISDEINQQSYHKIDPFKLEGTIESDVFLDSQKRV